MPTACEPCPGKSQAARSSPRPCLGSTRLFGRRGSALHRRGPCSGRTRRTRDAGPTGSPQLGQAIRFGAATLSWLARRMSRFERLVRRLGTATTLSLTALTETAARDYVLFLSLRSGTQARVDASSSAALAASLKALRPDTWASLRTQGDHRNSQQELVADEVVEDDRVAVVGDDVGLFGRPPRLVLVVALRRACRLPPRALGGRARRGRSALRARAPRPGSRQREQGTTQVGRERAAHDHVGPAPREAQVELAVALGRPDLGALEDAAEPAAGIGQLEVLAARVEVAARERRIRWSWGS